MEETIRKLQKTLANVEDERDTLAARNGILMGKITERDQEIKELRDKLRDADEMWDLVADVRFGLAEDVLAADAA